MNDASAHRVMLVEDDAPLAAMISDYLEPHGYNVQIESRGDIAVDRIARENPDLVILDVNLPGLDGFGVCRAVRARYTGAIIMLTARGDEVDEVIGLEVGADDYLAKPVRPRALLARLRTHLRRSSASDSSSPPPSITVGTLVVDGAKRTAQIEDESLDLTSAEYDLLELLAQNAGRALSRNDIYMQIHGTRYDGLDRSIDLRVSRLRKKLGDDPTRPKRIKSVRGVGYMLSFET
ncbi:MAG: response regulator transcription factor [Pirellulaceae bacterium]|jgi:DNA-binding response OmpR family regulator|nr:response regulator transcription factor [Pirellulaceae bacterium]MDP7015492.1 response regulator transcription factor [Pirellulaceae bacterium]